MVQQPPTHTCIHSHAHIIQSTLDLRAVLVETIEVVDPPAAVDMVLDVAREDTAVAVEVDDELPRRAFSTLLLFFAAARRILHRIEVNNTCSVLNLHSSQRQN